MKASDTHEAPIVVRDVNDVHMAKGSSLSENTKMKEGARGIEKSNWGIEKFDGKIKEWNLQISEVIQKSVQSGVLLACV